MDGEIIELYYVLEGSLLSLKLVIMNLNIRDYGNFVTNLTAIIKRIWLVDLNV